LKQIIFKTPERANGYHYIFNETYEVTYIGRNLEINDDNFSWKIVKISTMDTHIISVLSNFTEFGMIEIQSYAVGYPIPWVKYIPRQNVNTPKFIIDYYIEMIIGNPYK
jgi:hypothetical protein